MVRALRKLEEAVVVITGASSGIGRATALAFARRSASVVLAARRTAALEELAVECQRAGAPAPALAVTTDVTDEDAVRSLAQQAVDRFGRVDVWVNNAGVLLYGRFEDCPPEAFRRVVETNFFGYVHGARAALPHFRRQGGGVLINNVSMAAIVAAPYWTAYSATKFALRGFCAALRQELREGGDGKPSGGSGDAKNATIHVCAVFPGFTDTPLFQHAANCAGRAVKPVTPSRRVSPPERVADIIVRLAEKPQAEVTLGGTGRLARLLRAVAPGLLERGSRREFEQETFGDTPQAPTAGNLFQPMEQGTGATGGWSELDSSG